MYRTDWTMRLFGMIVMIIVMIFVLSLPFEYVDELAGWSRDEMIIVLLLYYVSNGLAWAFFKMGLSQIEMQIRLGTLDTVLAKPVSSMFAVSFFEADVTRIAEVLMGLGLVVWHIVHGGMSVEVVNVFGSMLVLLAGLVFVYSFYLMVNCLSFWTTETYLDQVVNPLFTIAKYSVDIWGKFSAVLYWVVPLALISTVPAGVLLGKFSLWLVPGGLVLAGLWLIAARLFWKVALRNYSGVGS